MVTKEKACKILKELKPTLLMVLAQCIFTLVNILFKLAANDGMNLRILVAYRFLFGACFMVPLSYIMERKKRPKLTWTVVFYAVLCGLFGGALGQNLYLLSLVFTSATFASAMTNLSPAMTFIVAVIIGLEKLGWKYPSGKAKVAGTVIGIGGAMLFTFYKGPNIDLWKTNINLLELTSSHHAATSAATSGGNFALGITLALLACVSYSLWLILQAKVGPKYPCPYSFTAMMTCSAFCLGVVVALCTERDINQWKLGWDIRLFTVAFSGIFGSGIMFTLVAMVVREKGPLFASVFNPLLLILVAIAGSLFMEEQLHLGSVLGAIVIISGLYVVLWGTAEETKRISNTAEETTDPEDQSRKIQNSIASSSIRSKQISFSSKRWEELTEEERRDSTASMEMIEGLVMYH